LCYNTPPSPKEEDNMIKYIYIMSIGDKENVHTNHKNNNEVLAHKAATKI
jgi:hypothetical protein